MAIYHLLLKRQAIPACRGAMPICGLIAGGRKDGCLLFNGISDILVSITDKGGSHGTEGLYR
jgi:hypothetical protein